MNSLLHTDGRSEDASRSEVAPASLHFRAPSKSDGAALWAMARDSGALDLNSPYAYMMMAHWFADTCVVVEQNGQAVGFVMGFRPPQQPDTLFVWQVAVDASQRGQGLARRMIQHLMARRPDAPGAAPLRFIEATVTPSNGPSNALFHGLAKHYGVPINTHEVFSAEDFPGASLGVQASHEGECLHRIGPIAVAGQ